jgi:hypothetical protein
MADDNNKDKERIKLLEEQNRLYKKQLELQEEGYSLSTSYVESLKEVLGIRSRLSTADSNLLSLNKQINKEILNQKTGLDKASDIQKQINKNADLLNKSKLLEKSLTNSIEKGRIEAVNRTASEIGQIKAKTRLIEEELAKAEKGESIDINRIESLKKQISSHEQVLDKMTKGLSSAEKQLLYSREQRKEIQNQNTEREKELKYLKEREKSLGLTGKLTRALSDIPGLREIFGDPEYMEQVNNRIDEIYQKTDKFPGLWKTLGIQIGTAGRMIGKTLMDPLVYLALMVKGFLSLNKAQTDFQRETGRTISQVDTLNTSLISSSDYIKQATAMTKELGLAADLIFTSETLQEATELVELMGMSADEATRLSVLSKINGKELKTTNENIIKIVNNFNKNNKAAISQKAVLQDVAKVSNSIAMTFGGNPEKIAAAAAEARKLGLTLETVDKVAESLLNFESSIASELSAELITGQQLNLEKARLLALNNDIAGLTKEIGNNEAVIKGFSSGNRIQQEAIASALGMSKDEISKMIFDQQIQKGLTEEQAAAASGVALEDMKRLSVQDSINKSIEKMGEALAGPLEMLAQIMSHATTIKIIFSAIGAIIAIQLVRGTAQFVTALGKSLAPLALRLSLVQATAAGEITAASAATLGLGVVGIIAGIIAGIAAMKSATSDATSIKDGVIDMDKGPVVSGGFGSVQLSDKDTAVFNGKSIIAGTNLGGKGNPSPTPAPQQDLSPLLNEMKALRQEQAKSNSKPTVVENSMNGTKFGTSVAMNTYKIQ